MTTANCPSPPKKSPASHPEVSLQRERGDFWRPCESRDPPFSHTGGRKVDARFRRQAVSLRPRSGHNIQRKEREGHAKNAKPLRPLRDHPASFASFAFNLFVFPGELNARQHHTHRNRHGRTAPEADQRRR